MWLKPLANGIVAQLVNLTGIAWSSRFDSRLCGVSVVDVQLILSAAPRSKLSRILEKSGVRVKWGTAHIAAKSWAKKVWYTLP